MSLVRALRSFREGDLSEAQLIAEVDRLLADDRADKQFLLETLEDEKTRIALPADVTQVVKQRIEAATASPVGVSDDPDASLTAFATQFAGEPDDSAPSNSTNPVTPAVVGGPFTPPRVGDVLNERFVLEEKIGAGGMSTVFKAIDQDAYGTPTVAVKVLNVEFGSHPDALTALKRETAKSQQLAHQNIVHVRDFGVHENTGYMWMEYLEGNSLAQRLKAPGFNGMPTEEAMCIVDGLAEALSHAHRARIVHADFKPGNVILTREPVINKDQVKVIDFGIARAFKPPEEEEGDKTIFDPGTLGALTPTYASPEMLEQQEPDPRDDVYALACMTYEMLTGRHPFKRMQATDARDEGLTPERRKGLTRGQYKALCGALEFDRAKRTPSVEAFCAALRNGGSEARTPVFLGVAAAAVIAAALYVISDEAIRWWENLDRLYPGATFADCDVACPSMLVVPKGITLQGSPAAEAGRFDSEGPVREVAFAAPFAVGQREITVGEFGKFIKATGHETTGCQVYEDGQWIEDAIASWRQPGFDQNDSHPVTCVSWHDAQAYAAWLVETTGKDYRLPSSSEWEHVARAGGNEPTWWGTRSKDACDAANIADQTAAAAYPGWAGMACRDRVVHTAPVASFKANDFGAFDTLGNVFEWVADCWNASYDGAPTDGSAWRDGDCSIRGLRGGSWFSRPEFVRAAYRNRFDAEHRSSSIGFRVARDIAAEELRQ